MNKKPVQRRVKAVRVMPYDNGKKKGWIVRKDYLDGTVFIVKKTYKLPK